MKKIFMLLISASFFTFKSFAQRTTIGFTVGNTLASYKTDVDNESASSKSKIGFTTGIVSDIPLGKRVSFQPALQFTQKGGKETFDGDQYKLTTTLNYLEMPLNILVKTNAGKARFYAGAGPSLALGLWGKMKLEGGGESDEADINFGNKDYDDLKALDVGMNFLAGCQFSSGWFISANYNSGLSNLFIDGDKDNNSFKNRYFGIRVGYMLKGKNKKT